MQQIRHMRCENCIPNRLDGTVGSVLLTYVELVLHQELKHRSTDDVYFINCYLSQPFMKPYQIYIFRPAMIHKSLPLSFNLQMQFYTQSIFSLSISRCDDLSASCRVKIQLLPLHQY